MITSHIVTEDLKVLFCEDSDFTVKSLSGFLNKRFAEVFYAINGIQGLELFQKYHPELVITDIKMPEMDGLQMARRIREEDKHVKIIIISAYDEINYFMEAIDYGINAFIKKPVNLKLLESQIKELLNDMRLQKRIKDEESSRIQIQKDKEKLFSEIRQDLAMARRVQEYLLPDWLFLNSELVFTSAYNPSLDVGGDLFGYYSISPGRFVFYLGDVSGHGLKSAMLMMAANSTINMLIEQEKQDLQPSRLLNRLNRILSVNLFHKNNYMTLILGTIDTSSGEVNYIRAGHPEIIIYDYLSETAELLINDKGTIPVGWVDNYTYSIQDEDTFVINQNQKCFIYSDGLFECNLENGYRLGQDGLLELLERKIPETNALTPSLEIMELLKSAGYNISQDDFTLVSFFLPTSTTFPGLESFLQAMVPEDIDLDQIECRDFLEEKTGNIKFAHTFENDINILFQSENFRRESMFISSFILLLIFEDKRVECRFWIKYDQQETERIEKRNIYLEMISEAIKELEISRDGYIDKVDFVHLGEFLEIRCILTHPVE